MITPKARQNHIFGEQKPLNRSLQNFACRVRPGRNHACQFWWRSVKGFWCVEGSNFGLFHWLASSPLKHSRTTVRVCDVKFAFRGAKCLDIGSTDKIRDGAFRFLELEINVRMWLSPTPMSRHLVQRFARKMLTKGTEVPLKAMPLHYTLNSALTRAIRIYSRF